VLVTYLSLIADRYDRKICFEEIIYRWLTLHTCEKWHAKKGFVRCKFSFFYPMYIIVCACKTRQGRAM